MALYQALYRKYRPMVFTDVAGQPVVTDTLRAQVSADRLSHAYLFTGTRGTGKTTCAKILARAANCLSPVAGNPCNACVPCLGALDGSLLDVMEIDAASNSGVDNIRALRDEAAYTPVSARKRVYIIDEVHMLSAGAFNALLKTLEEPPSYVLFILATTETHKVPATILSRCQRFAFRRLSENDISERLLRVAALESLDLTQPAASLLARLADGALRDALSLLDQTAAVSDGTIDEQKVYQSLGMAGEDSVSRLADAMARGGSAEAMTLFTEQINLGRDISSLLGELSQVLRGVLLSKLRGEDAGSSTLAELPPRELLDMLSAVQDALTHISRSPQPRIEAELCVLKICNRAAPNIPPPVGANNVRPQPAPTPAPTPAPEPTPESNDPTPVGANNVRPQSTENSNADEPQTITGEQCSPLQTNAEPPPLPAPVKNPGDFKTLAAGRMPPSLKSFLLNDNIDIQKDGGLWRISVPDTLSLDRLSEKNAVTAMEAAASELAGHPVSVRVVIKAEPERPKNEKVQSLLNRYNN